MTISVIVPTYNGAAKITNTLHALEQQNYQDFEVIVAIDGSTDDTFQLLQNSNFAFKSFKVISQSNKGRAAIRNFGAKEASGDLLVFYDDDTRPNQDSLQKHLSFHQNKKNCLYGGLAIEDPDKCHSDILSYKRFLSLKWTAKYKEGLNELNKVNLFLTAANFSIPKSFFEKLGGFDERLTDAEDHHLATRAIESGYSVYFDKSNIAWHDDFITCRSYIKRRREYQTAGLQLKKPQSNSLLKKLFYGLFSHEIWVKLIDKDFFVQYMPSFLRYKLYELVIWGLSKYYPGNKY